jgi:hypothetical protein
LVQRIVAAYDHYEEQLAEREGGDA